MARICKDAQPLRAVRLVRTAFFCRGQRRFRKPLRWGLPPAGKPWTVPLERWIFPVSTINLATASDNPDRARVYTSGTPVQGTAGSGSVRDRLPNYSGDEAGCRGGRT